MIHSRASIILCSFLSFATFIHNKREHECFRFIIKSIWFGGKLSRVVPEMNYSDREALVVYP